MCVFVSCPKQGLEMETVVLQRVGFLGYFCPKQGQDFKPSASPLHPNMGQVPPQDLRSERFRGAKSEEETGLLAFMGREQK